MIDKSTGKLCVLLEQTLDKGGPKLSGNVVVACVPEKELSSVVDEISTVTAELAAATRKRHSLVSDGAFQSMAAACDDCSLCKVCAGNHRRYFDYSWPVGGEKCFVNLSKRGKPLQDKPCVLCDTHDDSYRRLIGDRKRNLSAISKLRNNLMQLRVRRKQLFENHKISVDVFKEY